MLSPRLLDILRAYWRAVRPREILFPGAIPDRAITTGSVQSIVQHDPDSRMPGLASDRWRSLS